MPHSHTGISGVAQGPGYVQTAMESMMPCFGNYFVVVALFFCLYLIIVTTAAVETNIAFINRKIHRPWLTFETTVPGWSTVYGTVRTADSNRLMAWLNIIAIVLYIKVACQP